MLYWPSYVFLHINYRLKSCPTCFTHRLFILVFKLINKGIGKCLPNFIICIGLSSGNKSFQFIRTWTVPIFSLFCSHSVFYLLNFFIKRVCYISIYTDTIQIWSNTYILLCYICCKIKITFYFGVLRSVLGTYFCKG